MAIGSYFQGGMRSLKCSSINGCCSGLTTIAMGHEMSEAEEEIARNYADEDAV